MKKNKICVKFLVILSFMSQLLIKTTYQIYANDIEDINNEIYSINNRKYIVENSKMNSIEEAADYMRYNMAKRASNITLTISNVYYYKEIGKDILYKALENYKGCKSNEGDYLEGEYNGASWTMYNNNQKNEIKIIYKISYLSTYTEEQKVEKQIKKVLDSLNVYDKDDFTKVKAVHDYIVKNIKYDYNHKNYSVYDALINKKVVCHGYANLTYRMLKELEVDCRYVYGYTNKGEKHAWNIVKIGKVWYNIDNTWDATNYEDYKNKNINQYLLKNNSDFKNHIRKEKYNTTEFNKNYPMAKISLNVKNDFLNFKVYTVKNTSRYVKGTGVKDANVKAYVNGRQIGKTVKVDSKNNYSIYIPLQKKNTKITVKISKSNYTTISKTITVK